MEIDLTFKLKKIKDQFPCFDITDDFLFDLGKRIESVYPRNDQVMDSVEKDFMILVSKVFPSLSISTIPFDSTNSLYYLMIQRYYEFVREQKLSSLMEAFVCFMTFKKDVYHL